MLSGPFAVACNQVVDLLEELVMRGLAPSLAAVLLDSGALGLGLSLWAASPDDSDNSSVCDVAESNTTPGPSQSSHSSHSSSSNGEAAGAADNSPASAVAGRAAVVDAAMAVMRVALMLDDGRVSLKSFQTFVRRDSSHHFISQRVVLLPGAWKRCVGSSADVWCSQAIIGASCSCAGMLRVQACRLLRLSCFKHWLDVTPDAVAHKWYIHTRAAFFSLWTVTQGWLVLLPITNNSLKGHILTHTF